MSVFIDTSALYAWLSDSDPHHAQALAIRKRLGEEGIPFVTHDWICMETLWLLRKRKGRPFSVEAADAIFRNPSISIRAVDSDLREEALNDYKSRSISLVDAASFAFMRREGLERAFAFDKDFATAGFKLESPS